MNEDLSSSKDGQERTGRALQSFGEVIQLFLHEVPACTNRKLNADLCRLAVGGTDDDAQTYDRAMCTMSSSERVKYENVAELRQVRSELLDCASVGFDRFARRVHAFP